MRSLCLCASLRLSASLFISLFFSPFFCSMRLCPSLRLSVFSASSQCICVFSTSLCASLHVSGVSAFFSPLCASLCPSASLCVNLHFSFFLPLFRPFFAFFLRSLLYAFLSISVFSAFSRCACVFSASLCRLSACIWRLCVPCASQSLSVSLLFLGVCVFSSSRLLVFSSSLCASLFFLSVSLYFSLCLSASFFSPLFRLFSPYFFPSFFRSVCLQLLSTI